MKKTTFLKWAIFSLLFLIPTLVAAKKVKYSPHVYYEGSVSGGKPNGDGVLYCTLSKVENFGSGFMKFVTEKNYDPLTAPKAKDGVCDVIKGFFTDTHVINATVIFNSGWAFYGDLDFDPSDKEFLTIQFARGGTLVAPSNYNSRFSNKVIVEEPFKIVRKVETFAFGCSNISVEAETAIKTPYLIAEDLPSNYLIRNNYNLILKINQVVRNKKEEWEWITVPSAVYKNKDGFEIRTTESSGKTHFTYVAPNGDFYNSATGRYRFTMQDGVVGFEKESNNNIIVYNNGDQFRGKVVFVDRDNSNKYLSKPSFNPMSSNYIGSIKLENGVKPYTGHYKKADGNEYSLTDGLTEKELEAKKLREAQEEAEKQAQLKKAQEEKRAQQIANQKKAAEDKRITQDFIKIAWGKTFTFKKYQMMQRVNNGEYSVKFLSNRQDIFVRVNGRLEWLKFVEYSDDGKELVCRIWDNYSLTGTVYVKPMKHEGKWALKFLHIDGMNTTFYLFN